MPRFIYDMLWGNRWIILIVEILYLLILIISKEHSASIFIVIFFTSPLFVSISNKNTLKIKDYLRLLLSIKNIKYYFLMTTVLAMSAVSGGLAAAATQRFGLSLALIFSFTLLYVFSTPYLIKIATNSLGSFPSKQQIVYIFVMTTGYTLLINFLNLWRSENALSVILTTVIGTLTLLLSLCSITAVATSSSTNDGVKSYPPRL